MALYQNFQYLDEKSFFQALFHYQILQLRHKDLDIWLKAYRPKLVKEGFELIHNKIYKTLTNQCLKPMNSLGKSFDPDIHEAITKIPATKDKMKGKVMDVIEKGYILNDKVIRFAKVVVGE